MGRLEESRSGFAVIADLLEELHAASHRGFSEYTRNVIFHRLDGDEELFGNLIICQARRNQLYNLLLTGRNAEFPKEIGRQIAALPERRAVEIGLRENRKQPPDQDQVDRSGEAIKSAEIRQAGKK